MTLAPPTVSQHMRGAQFHRVDLHVHTPASKDAGRYGTTEAADIVKQALDSGLTGMAVTDHNTADWVDRIREAATGTALTVFPGVEISTRDGHLLAIFAEDAPITKVQDLLVRAGFDSDSHGDLQQQANLGMDDLAQLVVSAGGMAIPAHVDGPAGFLKVTTGQRRLKLITCPDFAAFEALDPELVRNEFSSRGRTQVALVQGSDSTEAGSPVHTVRGIGRRYSVVKASMCTLRALRLAFADPEMKVFLQDQPIVEPEWHIADIRVRGGFLDGQEFALNPNVTCLIGGTGSGKSLTIELIRFALNQQSNISSIRREVDSRLSASLGDGGAVELRIRRKDATFRVTRTLVSGKGSDCHVVEELPSGETQVVPLNVALEFPIAAFSQGEVIEYARQSVARLSLVDEALDLDDLATKERDCIADLKANAKAILEVEANIAKNESALAGRSEKSARAEALSTYFDNELVRQGEAWAAEEQQLTAAQSRLDGLTPGTSPVTPSRADAPAMEGTPNAGLVSEANKVVAAAFDLVAKSKTQLTEDLKQQADRLQEIRKAWAAQRTEYNEKLKLQIAQVSDAVGRESSLKGELDRLHVELAELAAVEAQNREQYNPRLASLLLEREELLSLLQTLRQQRRSLREAEIVRLNLAMGGSVKLSLNKESDDLRFRAALEPLRKGSYVREDSFDGLVEHSHPIKLAKTLRDGGTVPKVDDAVLQAIRRNIEDKSIWADVYDMQVVPLDDSLSVRFQLEEQTYRDIEALAHGQKCTAILVVVMAKGSSPLLVDQPEDAVHTPWIEEYLVERLRKARGTRQFIFATRAPGIVVSADAEQVIELRANANKAEVVMAGALDYEDANAQALHHMEGGRIPFERRRAKYEL